MLAECLAANAAAANTAGGASPTLAPPEKIVIPIFMAAPAKRSLLHSVLFSSIHPCSVLFSPVQTCSDLFSLVQSFSILYSPGTAF